MTELPQPADINPELTARDRENARIRREIAARQAAEYALVERLALAALGPGWSPWMKLTLVDSDYHRSGNTEPAATVFKVYHGDKKLSENAVYLRQMPDGEIRQAASYEPLVGDLLRETHPARTLDIRGQPVACPRYSVLWSPLERYEPLSAAALAARRASRERNRAQRAEQQWQADHPLLAWAERVQSEGRGNEGREPENVRE